jgi:NADH-quinone oxidoreductase subunit L
LIGYFTIGPMLYGDFFKDAIVVDSVKHGAMAELAKHWQNPLAMAGHAFVTLPFWLALGGVVASYVIFIKMPHVADSAKRMFAPVYKLLENKYYMDWINENILARAARGLGLGLWKGGDATLIDGAIINGSARMVGRTAGFMRHVQTGQLYWYAFVMVLGVFGLMTWQLWPYLHAWWTTAVSR